MSTTGQVDVSEINPPQERLCLGQTDQREQEHSILFSMFHLLILAKAKGASMRENSRIGGKEKRNSWDISSLCSIGIVKCSFSSKCVIDRTIRSCGLNR